MTEAHWEKIMESAESFIDEKKTQKRLPEPALVLGDDSEQQQQYKELLHDPMFD